MSLTISRRRADHISCILSLNLGWPYSFLVLGRVLQGFRKNSTEMQCPYNIIVGGIQNIYLISGEGSFPHLVNVTFAKFLHFKVSIFPFPHSILRKQIIGSSPSSRELSSTYRGEYQNILLQFFCKENLSLFTCSIIFNSMNSYFIIWAVIQ